MITERVDGVLVHTLGLLHSTRNEARPIAVTYTPEEGFYGLIQQDSPGEEKDIILLTPEQIEALFTLLTGNELSLSVERKLNVN